MANAWRQRGRTSSIDWAWNQSISKAIGYNIQYNVLGASRLRFIGSDSRAMMNVLMLSEHTGSGTAVSMLEFREIGNTALTAVTQNKGCYWLVGKWVGSNHRGAMYDK